MNKQWIFRNGEKPFSVTETVMPLGTINHVSVSNTGGMRFHNPDGVVFNGNVDFDLIPYEPYSDYENGNEVYVHDGDDEPQAAYFFGLDKNGNPLTYPSGTSPFTWVAADGPMSPWDYCYKAKEDK
jgi:hypothetical protein